MNHSGNLLGYWEWLWRGSGGKPGYRSVISRWLPLHVMVGGLIAYFLPIDLSNAASAILLPLAGVLVGLSLAWAGAAYAALSSSEIRRLARYEEGGIDQYVFVFETSILILLFTLVLWGFAGLRFFDSVLPTVNHFKSYLAVKWTIFTFSSLALRECWQIVHWSHTFLRLKIKIADIPEIAPAQKIPEPETREAAKESRRPRAKAR